MIYIPGVRADEWLKMVLSAAQQACVKEPAYLMATCLPTVLY
jgi:hypothetical protein